MEGDADPGDEMKHLAIVAEAIAHVKKSRERREGRSAEWQMGRRELEGKVRAEAVEYQAFAVIRGESGKEAARTLGLSGRTLEYWGKKARAGSLAVRPRGRPLKIAARIERNEIIAYLREVGPGVGVGRIRAEFPLMARCIVFDILGRYRRTYLRENMLLIHELTWTMAGAVWAMDHAEPRVSMAGGFRAILAVRDLASGKQVSWQAVANQDAAAVIAVLEARFAMDGTPLVLKSDNGSAFTSDAMKDFLTRKGVIQLLSPPGIPQYNGAVESGIGAMKDRTSWQSALRGKDAEWTSDDLDAAQRNANESPKALGVPAPDEVWRRRGSISPELRATFRASVDAEVARERECRGLGHRRSEDPRIEAEIQRTAIRRALVAHGLLEIRRRRIPLPKQLLKRAKI